MATDWGSVFGDALKKPENQSALIKSGFDIFGSILGGNAQHQRDQQNQKQSAQDLARQRQFDLLSGGRAQENADFALRQGQQDDADSTVLRAMGDSPLQFQRERMKMNAVADALQAGGPSNLSAHMAPWARAGGIDTSKFRPSAEAEKPYWDAVAQASKGRFGGAGLGDVYGGTGGALDEAIAGRTKASGDAFGAEWAAHEAENKGNFDQAYGMASQDFQQAQEKQESGGGGFMGILGKVLPMATAFIPGVGPLMAAGISAAASGVGSKMQGGSWGDAIKSAAGGAASSALGSALNKAGSSVFGQRGVTQLDPSKLDPLKPQGIGINPNLLGSSVRSVAGNYQQNPQNSLFRF
jgi:hypothetical protein